MRSLTLKLTLIFLIVSLTGVGLVAFFIWGATSNEFDRFLLDRGQSDFVAFAATYYETNGSWRDVVRALRQQGPLPPPLQPGWPNPSPPPPFILADQGGLVVVAGGPYYIGARMPGDKLAQGVPVVVNGQVVGTVLKTGGRPNRNPIEEKYLVSINQALLTAALGASVIALCLGILLARTVTRPVHELISATHAMAKGKLKQQVPVRSKDELGVLTATFNQMSADLEHANLLRRQMTADIAHDLRTPLTIITGYLESMRDSVLTPTPERIEVLYNEARYLNRLVEDLRTLSLADAGELSINRRSILPRTLLEQQAATFQHQASQDNICLKVQSDPDLPEIHVDPERMGQVLGNLVSNALHYTPDSGEVLLSAQRQTDVVLLSVQDNGAGIAPEVLPYIFDRFYRGDDSRQGSESGLGLAIARAIVELHGGKITAQSDGIGRGSSFSISLPNSIII